MPEPQMNIIDPGQQEGQYTLGKILMIWALAAAPMGIITWAVMPFLIDRTDVAPGLIFMPLIVVGLIWQGALSYIILRKEVVPFTRANLARRLWMNHPIEPRTGGRNKRLYLWAVLAAVVLFVWDQIGLLGFLDETWVDVFPAITQPEWAMLENLSDIAVGHWWLLALLLPWTIFNYILGEELLFRGVLLPKMNGVFGNWDWVANAGLFTLYHFHQPWEMPSQLIPRDWIFPFITKRFRSFWMGVIVHGSIRAIGLYVIFTLVIMGKL